MKAIINLPDRFYQKIQAFAEQEGYGTVEEFIAELTRQYIRSQPQEPISMPSPRPLDRQGSAPVGYVPLTPELEASLNQVIQQPTVSPPVQQQPREEIPLDNPHAHSEVEAEGDVAIPIPSVTPPIIKKKRESEPERNQDIEYARLGGKCQVAQIFSGYTPCLSGVNKSYSIANKTIKTPTSDDYKRVHLCDIHSNALLQSEAYAIKL